MKRLLTGLVIAGLFLSSPAAPAGSPEQRKLFASGSGGFPGRQ